MVMLFSFPAFAGKDDPLRQWAFAQCLAHAYDAPALRRDALALAKTYERGADAASYDAALRLVELYLGEDAPASTPLGRCTELRDGSALDALIREHQRQTIG